MRLTFTLVIAALGVFAAPSGARAFPLPQLPDLNVKSIKTGPVIAQFGYTVEVCNSGSFSSGAFDVHLLYNAIASPACGAPADAKLRFGNVEPGTCAKVTHYRTFLPQGSAEALAYADGGCKVPEWNESNNIATQAYGPSGNTTSSGGGTPPPPPPPAGKPDLQVTKFIATPALYAADFEVEVCNRGSADVTSSFDVEIFRGSAAPSCSSFLPSTQKRISALAAGACTTVKLTAFNTAGTYTYYALADGDCKVTESSESNNTRSTVVTISKPSGGGGGGTTPPPEPADLVLKKTRISADGGDIKVETEVCNVGKGQAPVSRLALFVDAPGGQIGCKQPSATQLPTPPLAPGKCFKYAFTHVGAAAGVRVVQLMVDADCAIAETDEVNNTSTAVVTVGGGAGQPGQPGAAKPNLQITDLLATPSGSAVLLSFTVCNTGAATTSPIAVGLYANAPSGCGQTPSLVVDLAPLASGCSQQTVTAPNRGPGEHQSWVMVDWRCTIDETNETDNTRSVSYRVAGSPGGQPGAPYPGGQNPSGQNPGGKAPAQYGDGANAQGGCSLGGSSATGLPLIGLALLGLLGLRRRRRVGR